MDGLCWDFSCDAEEISMTSSAFISLQPSCKLLGGVVLYLRSQSTKV